MMTVQNREVATATVLAFERRLGFITQGLCTVWGDCDKLAIWFSDIKNDFVIIEGLRQGSNSIKPFTRFVVYPKGFHVQCSPGETGDA